MKIDAYRDKLIRIGYFLGIGLLFYFFFAYALPLLLPFLLAFLFAVLLKAPADWLAQRLDAWRQALSDSIPQEPKDD